MEYLIYDVEDKLGLLKINRPEALNALNSQVMKELAKLLEEIAVSDIRCLIITGEGEKAFVAGADISEMKDMKPEEARDFSKHGNIVMEMIEHLPMPVIAAVNGYALGGGCELALSCDIRICSSKAVFALPEVGLGIFPGYGGLQRLSRTVGLARAKELAFTTRRVKAEEAFSIGLANHVVAPEELMTRAMDMAREIAENAPLGVQAAKKTANESVGMTLREAAGAESELFGKCFATMDQKEGMSAFMEKRKHNPYTGK